MLLMHLNRGWYAWRSAAVATWSDSPPRSSARANLCHTYDTHTPTRTDTHRDGGREGERERGRGIHLSDTRIRPRLAARQQGLSREDWTNCGRTGHLARRSQRHYGRNCRPGTSGSLRLGTDRSTLIFSGRNSFHSASQPASQPASHDTLVS